VQQSGSQGVELLNWMAMRGAMTDRVSELHRNYHIPISDTAAATVVYANEPEVRREGV
jgi:protocatechuate 4,5-dioxygenase, beta chain